VPQTKHLRVHKGDEVRAGEPLVDGPLDPHDILAISGEEEVQGYLLREIQSVYRSQGVTIDDKHIEIIVGSMMRKVSVKDPGDSEFLPGAVVDRFRFRRENERLRKERKKPATGETLLLGITKASLSSESFISAASFQETTKVLTEAALAGRRDNLVGLKENVILGHLVPTGTGFRDHSRTRVKKNIDFGELGNASQFEARMPDPELEAIVAGFDPLTEPPLVLDSPSGVAVGADEDELPRGLSLSTGVEDEEKKDEDVETRSDDAADDDDLDADFSGEGDLEAEPDL
jgi:DNA-directed RNA polymerase subunit beta'